MKKLTITIALMLVVALAMPAFGASFSDVPSDHWAYDAINKLVAAGIVEGYPDGEYKGQQSMTRYEMAVMVSRALDNIVDEMEAMGEGLTTGQAEDVTAIVKSLMEKNSQDELSDAQAEEVADIVDALTFELRSELKVLGAEVDALGKDVDELEAKVAMMDVPEDNIEFGMDVTTTFEVANYGEDNTEKLTSLYLLSDGDAIDEDFVTDIDEFVSEKAFFQEYDFNINGALGDAEFNLAVDTITNVFTDEDHVFEGTFGEADTQSNGLEMDSALLEVVYDNYSFKMGDLDDYSIAPYFTDEEDREGIEMMTSYMDNDITVFALGSDTGNDRPFLTYDLSDPDNLILTKTSAANAVASDSNDEETYGFTVGRDMSFGRVTGKVFHARDVADILTGKNEVTTVGLQVEDVVITDAVSMGAEVAFNDWDDETNNVDGSDTYFNVNGEFVATDALTLNATVETVGDEFVAPYNDLEEDSDYNMFDVGAEYALNENNTVTGGLTMVQPGDDNWPSNAEDKFVYSVGLENLYGDFTNNASIEFTQEDGFVEDHEVMVIELGTEYAWSETLTVGASLVNKNEEVAAGDVISYNYLKAFADKKLTDNITWNTEATLMDGTVGEQYQEITDGTTSPKTTQAIGVEEDAQATSLTTSLSVSF